MWQTVGSDDDSGVIDGVIQEFSDKSSESISDEAEKAKGRKQKKDNVKEKKHKKEKKKKKDKKQKKNKESKHAVDQNEYGKYGIIREEDFFRKQREFEAYMSEVKKMPGIMGQGKREIREYFKSFMEDYNTATMPHVKFYNYEAWEVEDYKRQQDKKVSRHSSKIPDTFNDEEERRAEIRRGREQLEKREFDTLLSKLARDKNLREDMRRQDELRLEYQMAYKQGDMDKVKRIEKLLAPDEEGPAMKHPWA